MKLYELAGADPARRFSPYCWRTRMALAHKGLDAETIPWRFSDKGVIAFSGQDRVPVLVDGDKVVADSWAIANYLEDAYPGRPSLFGGSAAKAPTRFINAWTDNVMQMALLPVVLLDIFNHLHEKDRDYFRTTREKRIGMSLEAFCADRDKHLAAFRQVLQPLRVVLAAQPYLGGETANYADYIVLGSFQWARCISSCQLLTADDPVTAWRGRLFDAFGGLAGRALGYAA